MKKYLLLLLLAIFAVSCSKEDESTLTMSTNYLTFPPKNSVPQEVTVISDKEWVYQFSEWQTVPDWCSVTRQGNKLIITVTENKNEIESREATISLSFKNGGMIYIKDGGYSSQVDIKINQSKLTYTQEELSEIVNDITKAKYDEFCIENGVFKYTGQDYPFELAIYLLKIIDKIETLYPYTCHYNEYITISGDDGKNLKITGKILVTDFIDNKDYYTYPKTPPFYGDYKAGTFSIYVSGAYNNTFSHYIQE